MLPIPRLPWLAPALLGLVLPAGAGPYSASSGDPSNAFDAPVPGFVGPHGVGKARLFTFDLDDEGQEIYENPGNYVNPLFFGWASEAAFYQPSETVSVSFSDPERALGPVSGDNFDVVSLGDQSAASIFLGNSPGTITLAFAKPIRDLSGADFVIFENGHITQTNEGGAGVGGIFAELAYVEVSADGETFVPLPATSLNAALAVLPGFGTRFASIDATNVFNLAGKHVNAYGQSWGTPFDLAGSGLSQITHIRLVDVPGSGAYKDSADRPIYDAWKTISSGGFDLEAIGAISVSMTYAEWPQLENVPLNRRGPADDPDGDGIPNLLEYACGTLPWLGDAVRPTLVSDPAGKGLSFLRDERAGDLRYEVQVSENAATWVTLASGDGGAPLQAAPGQTPLITDVSAGSIRSVGVIRRTAVSEQPPAGSTRRFYRLKVTLIP
ncbi:MAG: hypothetical protein EOP88_06045 [Verrucomicrobiaceae bacterium]|nr:MAG: hypothetical protein EOP88_06045 [Verrucomicrobiaceae bacterium]